MALTGYIPVAEITNDDELTGKTVVTGSTGTAGAGGPLTPDNPANSNDRVASTYSERWSGVFLSSPAYWWSADLGASFEVTAIYVWDRDESGSFWRTPFTLHPATVFIEHSSDGSSWTSAAFTYTTEVVPTGGTPTNTTEHRYTLNTPTTDRHWRIRKTIAAGVFLGGDAMREWFVYANTSTGSTTFEEAPETVDGSDASYAHAESTAITDTSGVFWRGDYGTVDSIGRLTALLGMENAGDVLIEVQGGDASDWSDAATIVNIPVDATGSLTGDELEILWDATSHRYWQLVIDVIQDVRVYEVGIFVGTVIEEPEPGRAILEIYVHDEDASRWGTATWATGAATGTEGIWSAAGWTDVTPEGVTAHVIWGSRRPSRGILHTQDGASWNVQTYDPDRDLDPGNQDSPYWPQLVAGLPIRISHDTTVIRTGYVDEMTYKHKPPYYQGQILATDTIALLHKASVPADSVLSDTLLARIQDAISAAGVAVGGIPLPPTGPAGPSLSGWIEGAATDDPTSVWEIIRRACEEVLWVPFVTADAGLGLRAWGTPLDRGREISAPNLEDLTSVINEDGVYSVVRVQPALEADDIIEREASPLPRYGRRVYERTETTINPDDWAAAVLAERSWPGVQYVPGTVHCFTAADVDYFGSLEIMERVQVTVPGAVSVSGRLLGGELWVEHQGGQRAKWMFNFAVATDGATAIGLDTLVSDQGGDFLIDDQTDTDFLEAD